MSILDARSFRNNRRVESSLKKKLRFTQRRAIEFSHGSCPADFVPLLVTGRPGNEKVDFVVKKVKEREK